MEEAIRTLEDELMSLGAKIEVNEIRARESWQEYTSLKQTICSLLEQQKNIGEAYKLLISAKGKAEKNG